MSDFDLVVVGGAWGGYMAALTLAQRGGGAETMVVERRRETTA